MKSSSVPNATALNSSIPEVLEKILTVSSRRQNDLVLSAVSRPYCAHVTLQHCAKNHYNPTAVIMQKGHSGAYSVG